LTDIHHQRRRKDQFPLVRGHHLHRHLGGMAVPGHRHRHRLPPRRRLRPRRSPAHRAGLGRAGQRGRRRQPRPGVVFHAGRGCQYTSAELAGLASDCAVKLSHGRTGQCWDNANSESFFASIKGKLLSGATSRVVCGVRGRAGPCCCGKPPSGYVATLGGSPSSPRLPRASPIQVKAQTWRGGVRPQT
jgi:hypothetical protein